MSDKLVKEITTTTTERYHENGSIREKITESKEKVYNYGFSEQQIAEAEVKPSVAPAVEPARITEPLQEKKNETSDLIAAAAAAINSKPENHEPIPDEAQQQPQQQQQEPQYQQPSAPYSPYQQYQPQSQYNVVSRGNPPAPGQSQLPNPPTFPWEKK